MNRGNGHGGRGPPYSGAVAGQNCSNCSAPLTFEAGQEVVDCSYCGTTNQVRGFANRIRVKLAAGAGAGAAGAGAGRTLGLLVAGLGLGIGIVVFIAARDEPGPTSPASPIIDLSGLPEGKPDAGVAPSALGSSRYPGWIPVAADPAVGGYERFDPVANLPWALGIARAWQADVQLGSIYLDGARTEGVLDLRSNGDWDVDYRFFSPSLRAEAERKAEVSEEEVRSEIRVMVSEGEVTALISKRFSLRGESPPAYQPRCGFGEVMEQAVSGGIATRPTYRVVMHHVGSGWRWAVSGKDIDSVIVQAASCSGTALPEPPPGDAPPPGSDPELPESAFDCSGAIRPAEDLSDLKTGFTAAGWRDTAITALDRRYPDAAWIVRSVPDPENFDVWFSGQGTESWDAVQMGLSAAVHEDVHIVGFGRLQPARYTWLLSQEQALSAPIVSTFHRSAIADDLPPAAASMSYRATYLEGDSGAQGFETLLDEFNAYTWSLLVEAAMVDQAGNRTTSARDGLLTMMLYTELYLARARTSKPAVHAAIAEEAELAAAVVTLWDRAVCALRLAGNHPRLGIEDDALVPLVFDPARLAEIDALRD